jgi:hypothetical protein
LIGRQRARPFACCEQIIERAHHRFNCSTGDIL